MSEYTLHGPNLAQAALDLQRRVRAQLELGGRQSDVSTLDGLGEYVVKRDDRPDIAVDARLHRKDELSSYAQVRIIHRSAMYTVEVRGGELAAVYDHDQEPVTNLQLIQEMIDHLSAAREPMREKIGRITTAIVARVKR